MREAHFGAEYGAKRLIPKCSESNTKRDPLNISKVTERRERVVRLVVLELEAEASAQAVERGTAATR